MANGTTVEEMRVVMDAETARLHRKLTEADRRMAQFQRDTAERLRRFDGYFRSAGGAVAALTAGLGVSQVTEYANAWTRVERSLSGSEQVFGIRLRSARELVDLANKARVDVEAYGKTYVRTAAAIRDYGYTEADAVKVTSALSMALKLGSAAGSEQASVMLQFSQALQKGKLDGDEFRSVMENAGVVQELLADRLKVSKGELISMAAAGKLKLQDLVGAMTDGAAKIERLFTKAPQTIDEAFTVLRNSVIRYVGDVDKATGASQSFVSVLASISANMDTVGNSALVLAAGLLSVFGPRMLAGVISFGAASTLALGPIGAIAGLVGGGAAAMALFGDKVEVTADGMVTLKDTAQALIDVVGARLTPMMQQASAAWQGAVNMMTRALDGIPVSFDDIVGAARKAVNVTIGLFVFAGKSIIAAFHTLPAAIVEKMIDVSNSVIAIVERMVGQVKAALNLLPGIKIEAEIDLGRLANPLTNSDSVARQAIAAAGTALGHDYVGGFLSATDGITNEIAAKARQIAEIRQWAAGTTVQPHIELKKGKPAVDQTLVDNMKKAAEQVQGVYRRALEATEHYREAVSEQYEKELRKFQELQQKKLITQQQFDNVRHNLGVVAAKQMNEAIEKEYRRLRDVTDVVASGMEQAFSNFTESGKLDFREMTRSILADLAKLAFKKTVIDNLFGESGKGFGLLGSVFGIGAAAAGSAVAPGGIGSSSTTTLPNFDVGGRPPVGMPSWVGERGRELFVPDVQGRIIPNNQLRGLGGGSGGQIVVRLEHSADFHARVDSRMQNVVVQRAPAIVGASVEATRRNLPGMMRQAQTRSL